MKAVRLHAYGQRPKLEEVADPKVTGPHDVIVRIGGAGLCRTDLHIVEGQWKDKSHVQLPYILGHENAGWVHAVGSAVEHVAVGDTVIVHPLISCGFCRHCRAGDDMHCSHGVFPGIDADGGFAEFLKTGARAVVKLDPKPKIRDEIFEDAATLGGMGFSAHFGQRDGGWFPVTQFRGRFFAVRAGIFESFRHRYAGGGSSFGFPRARQAPGITTALEWHPLPA